MLNTTQRATQARLGPAPGSYLLTIAACHLSPEGVVLGADSATTLSNSVLGTCHLDYAQKVFEVGPSGSSVGLVTWGLGQIGGDSHRTIAAELGFAHAEKPLAAVADLADALAANLDARYTAAYPAERARFRELAAKLQAKTASSDEEGEHNGLLNTYAGGYCLAGRIANRGPCEAFQILWGLHLDQPQVTQIAAEAPVFWGVPQIMQRLVFGIDAQIIAQILQSGKWTGSEIDLLQLVSQNQLMSPRLLPIREAIDWVHTVIHTTIRGTKFANWPHWCGGPVEIAVITTDRPFRWVRHKPLDAAIITAEEAGQ